MKTISENIIIKEFESKYEKEVIDLVGYELRSWKVVPQSNKPITDNDLYEILKIYSKRSRFWIALLDKKVIGTIGIKELNQNTAKLRRMFVYDKYHGTGIGQKLLNQALTFVMKNGYKEIILNSHPLFKRSHRFYQKNGFILISKDPNRYHFKRSFSTFLQSK